MLGTAPRAACVCARCSIRSVWEYACRHLAWNQALLGVGRPDQEQPSMARLYRCHRVPGSAEPCSATHPTDIAHPVVPSHARHRTPTEIAHTGSAEPCSASHPTQHSRAPPALYEAFGIAHAGIWPGARQRLAWGDRIKSSRAWLGSTDWGGSSAAERGSALPIRADQEQPSVARLYPIRADQAQPSMARLYLVGVVRRRGSGRPGRRAGPSGRRRL